MAYGKVFAFFLAVVFVSGLQNRSEAREKDYVDGEIIVKYKKESSRGNSRQRSLLSGRTLPKQFKNSKFEVFPAFFLKNTSLRRNRSKSKRQTGLSPDFDPELYQKITFDKSLNAKEVADYFKSDPDIKFAEPNYIRRPIAEPVSADPRSGEQWHLSHIHADSAWAFLQQHGIDPGGSRKVVVAVIDTGVDYNHEDLAANIWLNTAEVPNNGVDDDGNGFIDDIHGANVVGDSYSESGDPMDVHGHGTHVAGIIAAQGNNNVGVCGVAPNCLIMPIRAAQYSGVLTSTDIAEALLYAVDKGADIINMSFGGYSESLVEKDALETAFAQSVLVAAAGNDGLPNEIINGARPMYPACYPWVLGVMAHNQTPGEDGDWLADFSNWDVISGSAIEYELMAPGTAILSTLPDNQYGAWNGTSMGAPCVAGAAALLRSYFSDKDSYSSRFIMGQLAVTGEIRQGITYDPKLPPIFYRVLDLNNALTVSPSPSLSFLDQWIFDDSGDDDGKTDAGETIQLAIRIRNHWGKANDVNVTLRAWNGTSTNDDPYVTFSTDTVNYGAVGSFNNDDNGLIYDSNTQEITGVLHPFVLTVSNDCPNNHIVPIQLTMTCKNGFDPDGETLTFTDDFTIEVENGVELPRFIESDMTLTNDKYYIISDRTLISEGVTVTVEPNTQIQFWSSQPDSVYATQPIAALQVAGNLFMQGTLSEPIKLFPCPIYPNRQVNISGEETGKMIMKYVKVVNPSIVGADFDVDHCSFTQHDVFTEFYDYDYYSGPWVDSGMTFVVTQNDITSSKFSFLGQHYGYKSFSYVANKVRSSLFCGCETSDYFNTMYSNCPNSYYDETTFEKTTDTVFLLNHLKWNDYDYSTGTWGYEIQNTNFLFDDYRNKRYVLKFFKPKNVFYNSSTNQTYALTAVDFTFDINFYEKYAQELGGHLACINNETENSYIYDYIDTNNLDNILIGLIYSEEQGTHQWINGDALTYTNWGYRQPNNPTLNPYVKINYDGKWCTTPSYGHNIIYSYDFLMELEGEISQEDLDSIYKEKLLLAIKTNHSFQNNAILNTWTDPTPDHWLAFKTSQEDIVADSMCYSIQNNYWGGASEAMIEASITDFYDDFNRPKLLYKPYLTEAPETCWPFVVDAIVSTESRENASQVGAETITFTVTFNRDMDTTVQPEVTFGPDEPYSDFSVNGDWTDARTWKGTFNVTPITGDGDQFIRVVGAVAADDPWLVSGHDKARFQFEIVTSGTEAMALQAEGKEGRVDLSWTPSDFELLAGYNIYRSEFADGPYDRINSSIVHKDYTSYSDRSVTEIKPYYYKFTVVKTNLTESDFSSVASGTPTVIVQTYHLTVKNGSGSGEYAQGETVSVIAGNPVSGTVFDKWTGDVDYLANSSSSSTTLVMPGNAITIIAEYRTSTEGKYVLAVVNGFGSGEYAQGETVSVIAEASASGTVFDKWTGDVEYLANSSSSSTILVMPDKNITITAAYRTPVEGKYVLIVVNGSGSGEYVQGENVVVQADSPPSGKMFSKWSGQTTYMTDSTQAQTTVTIPAENITITAEYQKSSCVVSFITDGTPDAFINGATTQTIANDSSCSPVTAKAPVDHEFAKWVSANGVFYSSDNPLTVANVTSDLTIYAVFRRSDSSEKITIKFKTTPFSAGTIVSPQNESFEVDAGESFSIEAKAAEGHSFAAWTVSGDANITDFSSAATTLKAYGDTTVTAHFNSEKTNVEFVVNVISSPENSGLAVIDSSKSVFAWGELIPIKATVSSFKFLRWEVAGNGVLLDPYSSETMVKIRGNITVTAYFSTNAHQLTLSSSGKGLVAPNASLMLDSSNTMDIKAIPQSGCLFKQWEVVSGKVKSDYDNWERQANTTISIEEDTELKAVFEDTTDIAESSGKTNIKIVLNPRKSNSDQITIKNIPLKGNINYSVIDKTTSVSVDGNFFDFEVRARNSQHGKLKVGTSDSQMYADFKNLVWGFKASKASFSNIVDGNGLDIILTLGDDTIVFNYPLERKSVFSIKLPVDEDSDFGVLRGTGSLSPSLVDKDMLSLKGYFTNNDARVDSLAEPIYLTIDNLNVVMEPEDVETIKKKKGMNFIFPNKKQKDVYPNIKFQLCQDKEMWSFSIKKSSIESLVTPGDGIDIYLRTQNYSFSTFIPAEDIQYTTILKYNAK